MKLTKFIVCAVVLCIFAFSASAQNPTMQAKGPKLYYGNEELPTIAVKDYIGEVNYAATYVPAVKMYKAGLGLMIPGCVIAAFGVVTIGISSAWFASYDDFSSPEYIEGRGLYDALFNTGFPCLLIGGAGMVGTGAALYCIGKKRIQWCADDYNSTHSQVSLNLSSGRNGIGLALNF